MLVTFIINGEPVTAEGPPHTLKADALAVSHNTGRPPEDWDIRDETGRLVPEPLVEPGTYYLSLRAGFGGSHVNHRRRGYRPPYREMVILNHGSWGGSPVTGLKRDSPGFYADARWCFNQTTRWVMCANTFRQTKARRNRGIRRALRQAPIIDEPHHSFRHLYKGRYWWRA